MSVIRIGFVTGTAAVAAAGIFASLRITGKKLEDNVFVMQGAGEVSNTFIWLVSLEPTSAKGVPVLLKKRCYPLITKDLGTILHMHRTLSCSWSYKKWKDCVQNNKNNVSEKQS